MIVRDAAGNRSRGRPGRRAIANGTDDARFGAEELGAIRIAVFAMWLIEVAPDPLAFWAELPRSMNRPIGVFKLVPEDAWERVLEPEVLDDLQRLLVVLVALSAAGARPYRPLACAAAALLTAHQAVLRGFTFVNHEELALLICTYVLALFPAADAFSCPPRRKRLARREVYAGAIDAMSLALAVPYAGIAARRLVRAGPGIFAGESIPHWLGSLDALDPDAVGIGPWLLARPRLVGLLKAGFAVTTVFELLSPLCLIAPRLRRAWVPAIVAMHVGNRFTLKLFFWQNTTLIVLLFTGARRWLARRGRGTGRGRLRSRPA